MPRLGRIAHRVNKSRRGVPQEAQMSTGFYGLKSETIDGEEVSFQQYNNQVVLLMNVGKTKPHYNQMRQLSDKFAHEPFRIALFPCNQFGAQEPGSNDQVKGNIQQLFGGTIPSNVDVFTKVSVNGNDESPIFTYLKNSCDSCGGNIGWNFSGKFLIDRSGSTVERTSDNPSKLQEKIEQLLSA